jgi:hypothetical protein
MGRLEALELIAMGRAMMRDNCVKNSAGVFVRGDWTIEEHDRDGNLLSREERKNLVTASGRGLLWDIVLGVTPTLAAVAIGTGSAAPADGDTTLGTEVSRWQLTSMSRSGSVMTVRLFLGTTQGNGFTYTEAGIFNLYPSGGTMFNRITHSAKVKDANKTLTYLITLSLSSS